MFQENLLLALQQAGLPASLILSQRQLRAFPRSRTLWVRREQAKLASGLSIVLVPFLNLPVLRPLIVGLVILLNLIGWGWRQRYTPHRVVYTFNLTEPPGLFTLLGAWLIGAKAVVSLNDIHIPGQLVPATLARRLDFWLQKKLIPRFDGIVVVSKKIVEDFAPNRPFVRLEGGVKEVFFQQTHPYTSRLSQEKTPFTIASAGTLYEVNGINELLAAFALLSGSGYRLRIAGSGPLAEKVKQAAQADPRIEYSGYLSFEDVLAFYTSADVLINMRLTQTMKTDYFFPSKILEYLASGTPIITTCTGHIEEEYADFVFLLKDETPQGLARLIEQVATMDPQIRTQKGRAARDYIRVHNTWEAQGQQLAKFICNDILRLCPTQEVEHD
jgi:glycosyltransferase involved in cell wall biosynthesis